MYKKKYRNHSAEFKMQVLKQHLLDKIPVSQLCENHDIKPSLFYSWQKELFDRGPAIFEVPNGNRQDSKYQRKINQLEEKLVQKNEVLAELMQEHLNLKKSHGDL